MRVDQVQPATGSLLRCILKIPEPRCYPTKKRWCKVIKHQKEWGVHACVCLHRCKQMWVCIGGPVDE